MKILITGGAGFIGRELIRSIENKKEITCLIRRKSDFLEKQKTKTILCDLNNKAKLLKCIKGFDTVIHLAGIVNTRSQEEFYNKNVQITKNLLGACKANNVKRFIFTSTAVVVSKVQGPYSKSKIAAENLIKKSGLEYVILRPSVVYGKEDEKNLEGLIRLVKRFPIIPIIGSGKQKVQPVYIKDVANAIITATKNTKIKNKTYFITGPKPVAFEHVINLVIALLNKKCLKIHVPSFIPIWLVKIYERIIPKPVIVNEQMERLVTDKVYDISEARKDLNFNPIPIEEGLRRIIK